MPETKLTCTRRIQFCAGHRLLNHEGKCAHLHGHNYVALIEAEADALDEVGRVIDFSVLKERVGGWIEVYWDHGFLYNVYDVFVHETIAAAQSAFNQKSYAMPCNPTAENIARHLLEEVCPNALVGCGVRVARVTVWETENCFAIAEAR